MTNRQKADLAERLESERLAKTAEVASVDRDLLDLTDEPQPELEGRAQEETVASVLRQIEDRDHQALADIDEALARVADGTYGVCEECGEDIPVARLRAVPTARRCVDCQRQEELSQKLSARPEPEARPTRILETSVDDEA